jgi:hypothetical protein
MHRYLYSQIVYSNLMSDLHFVNTHCNVEAVIGIFILYLKRILFIVNNNSGGINGTYQKP